MILTASLILHLALSKLHCHTVRSEKTLWNFWFLPPGKLTASPWLTNNFEGCSERKPRNRECAHILRTKNEKRPPVEGV